MKNITVAVDDEVYQRARLAAAQKSTSVSKLVAGFLKQVGGDEERFQRLLAEERRLRKGLRGFNASDRLSREDVHRRR